MMHMRVTHRDEEGKVVVEKMPVRETRRPDTAKHFERKMEEQGLHRLERHPANGKRGIGAPPPKSGRGGKFTWEGRGGLVDSQFEPVPPAIDLNDPNYDEDGGEEAVVGKLDVAKAAEARDGVVAPPRHQEQLQQQ
ncbi:hypothetical protein GUJ93_ZPchr0012g21332 [Zizania palustris]|uniref:Uncharacterized protein n=1 Tax=Zizania palustris TaxID=103762 RepID=A0A8J5WMJ6_ZIZPA|nr:hypothetical protein GUJ93_ZPchr0012g21332 [Zizania palustris]